MAKPDKKNDIQNTASVTAEAETPKDDVNDTVSSAVETTAQTTSQVPPVEEEQKNTSPAEEKQKSNKVEVVANLEVKFSKKELAELVDKAKDEMVDEYKAMLLKFSYMADSFESFAARTEALERAATKTKQHAIAGEFANLHSALAVAYNKLKALTNDAKEYAATQDA